MAHLVRVKTTRHTDPETGRRVPSDSPGAIVTTANSRKWYGKGIPGHPPAKRVPLASDRTVAKRMLADLIRDAERGAADLPDADAARLPLATLLAEFEADLALGLASKARATTRKPSQPQVALTVQRVRDVLAGCKFTSVSSLNGTAPHKLATYLADRVKLPKLSGGFSAQSAEFFRKAAKRFAWWLSVRRRCPVRADLFDDVPAHDAKGNRVHSRRVIDAAELTLLLETTRSSSRIYRGLSGEDRFSIYLLALTTGFRAAELASLEVRSFLLDAAMPVVQLRAEDSKSGKPARQPIPLGVATHLREYLSGRLPEGPVWSGTWAEKPAKMLKPDLAEAGIAYKLDSGDGDKFLDFHALRHSYVSALAAAGVGPKELQVLARHSDPTITLGIYTHASTGSLSGAVERLALPSSLGDGKATLAQMPREELEAAAIALAWTIRLLLRA